MVSPVVSTELIRNAVYAVLWGCIFILAWIRIRYFDFKWAFSGVVALAHDVLVLLGVFAIFHKFEINSPFVAAALTVVGFSVHDTIIIFDRIRENLKLRKGSSFAETANISLLGDAGPLREHGLDRGLRLGRRACSSAATPCATSPSPCSSA